ncbi:MFS transporter [Derxia gummosa]|uniref:MFS transporter n=1 Tax=Derxia gummosa DSM 723 TaxID=1121388 RepID=A0A8B6X5G1_9BURK|nr:MFS transporter [Derxia gummosa]
MANANLLGLSDAFGANVAVPTDGSVDTGQIAARLDRLPATRSQWRLIVLLGFGMFFEMYDLFFSGYVAPGLVRAGLFAGAGTVSGQPGIASFMAALALGLFVGTCFCGQLADRYGRRAIFTWSLLGYALANLHMVLQTTATGILVCRFLVGIGIGVEIVTLGTYIAELSPRHMRGRAMAAAQAIGFTAMPVVAFISWALIPERILGLEGWRWVVLLGCHGAVFVWFVRRGLPESPRWLASRGRLAEADAVLREMERRTRIDLGGRALPAPGEPVAAPASVEGRFADLWAPPLRRRTLMLIAFHVFQTVGYYGFINWVPTLLVHHGVTVTSGLLYSSLMALAAPLGPLLGLVIADRFERKHVIVAMAATNMACGLLLSQAAAPVLVVSLGIGLTLAGNILSFTYHTYQQELFPTAIRARAVGFVYSFSRLSSIATSFVIAWVLGAAGTPAVFLLISAAMAIVMLAIGLFGPRTRGQSLEALSARAAR